MRVAPGIQLELAFASGSRSLSQLLGGHHPLSSGVFFCSPKKRTNVIFYLFIYFKGKNVLDRENHWTDVSVYNMLMKFVNSHFNCMGLRRGFDRLQVIFNLF